MHFPDLRDGIWRQNKKRENAGSQTVCKVLARLDKLDIYNPYPIIFKGLTINYIWSGQAKISSGVPAVYFHELKKKISRENSSKKGGWVLTTTLILLPSIFTFFFMIVAKSILCVKLSITSRYHETIRYINDRIKLWVILDIIFNLATQIAPQPSDSLKERSL